MTDDSSVIELDRRDLLRATGGAPFFLAPGVVLEANAQDGGMFEIDNVDPGTEVEAIQGEEVTVSADITNSGSESGSAEVRLTLFGEVVESKTTGVLDEGETEKVSFTGDTSLVPPGEWSGSMQTDGDTVEGVLKLSPVTEFEIGNPDPENKKVTVKRGGG